MSRLYNYEEKHGTVNTVNYFKPKGEKNLIECCSNNWIGKGQGRIFMSCLKIYKPI